MFDPLIELEVGAEKKKLTVDDKTEIKGEVAAGKAVKVWAKDGAAVRYRMILTWDVTP